MKKYLSLILVFLLVLTGCGKKENSVDVLKKVLTNETEVNSMEVKASVDFKMEQDGINVDLPLSISLKADMKDDKNGIISVELNDNPFVGAMKLYASLEGEKSEVYMPSTIIATMIGIEETETRWIVEKDILSTENEINLDFSVEDYKKIVDKVMEVVTEKDFVYVDKEDSVSHYQLKISADLIKRIFEKMEKEYDSSIEDVLKETLVLDVYIKDYMFTKVELDMTKMMSSMTDVMEEELDMSMIKKLSLSLEMLGYNNTAVTIPEDVKNNAITSEEYLRLYIGEE